ncbi:MAG: aspartate/glutamate racemase family protein [Thermovirgaceae bacterium]|nr:aspartate/glutamate racemase family protein [Thermovirgaceae bacterium]
MRNSSDSSRIGILCWESGQVPRGLVQLESLKGNSTNPDSYDFPVRFCRVKGANIYTILENPSRAIMEKMIGEAEDMAKGGIRAVTTSCGFNAIFQKELADALDIPVFTSSLLQAPFVHQILGKRFEIGVITAKKAALKEEHFRAAGITPDMPIKVFGMEKNPEWNKIFIAPDEDVDLDVIITEVIGTAMKAVEENPRIGAFILECTDLPPFSQAIRGATGRPVFDFITLVNYVNKALGD